MGKSEYMGIDARRCADVVGKPMEDRQSNQSKMGEEGIKQSARKVGE